MATMIPAFHLIRRITLSINVCSVRTKLMVRIFECEKCVFRAAQYPFRELAHLRKHDFGHFRFECTAQKIDN